MTVTFFLATEMLVQGWSGDKRGVFGEEGFGKELGNHGSGLGIFFYFIL